ncbi:cholecystokinin receptor type A-like isoform X2 [Mya arenaria]|uniref:cholecystokinin receptor type A-like isoform X2 n=1 Tax=Mya arenaria TaxID=6604 RepID=UPI0022E2A67E|nr:cholecystokinin receptor type A-like isoform X2 [Mya arenaria]
MQNSTIDYDKGAHAPYKIGGMADILVNSTANPVNSSNDTWDTTTTPFPMFRSPPLQLSEIITLPFYALIFILSVSGNLLVIITLIQNKRMRTVTNVFLLNLSVSDLLLAVFCMPFTIVPIMLKNFIFGEIMCIMIRYLQAVSVSVSCFTLVAISLERYFAICRPLHSRSWQTLKHSYKTIVVCWFVAFIVSIPIAVFTRHLERPSGQTICREFWNDPGWQKAYTIFLDLVLLVIPIIIMSISYGQIANTLWSGLKMDKREMDQNGHGQIFKTETQISTSKDGFGRSINSSENENTNKSRKSATKMRFNARGVRQTNNEKSRAAKKRVIKMLFAVVLEFFICWAPLYLVQTWITMDIEHATLHISNLSHTLIFLLSYISSCCNPITYCFMNKNFRNGFKAAFRCTRCSDGVRARHEMPSYYHYSSARTGVSHVSTGYEKVNGKEESDEL